MMTKPVKVSDINEGDLVDLESCPYLSQSEEHQAVVEFEYGVVDYVCRETADCIAIGYQGIDVIGYLLGTVLQVKV